jgi:hypothetical protein
MPTRTTLLAILAIGCTPMNTRPPTGAGGSPGGGAGGAVAGSGGGGGSGGSAGSGGSGGSSGSGGASVDAAPTPDAARDAALTPDRSPDLARDSGGDVARAGDAGVYERTGWTATSNPLPIKPPGPGAQGNENLDPGNAIDGKINTRWSLGDLHDTGAGAGPTAQKIGDQFTLDMKESRPVGKLIFWAGGPMGRGGPDARDYPGAVDVTVSDDCTTFGTTVATGMEPQPGCQNNGMPCDLPFTVTFPPGTNARCVRLTLTKVLKLGGGIWWAIDEIYVYP